MTNFETQSLLIEVVELNDLVGNAFNMAIEDQVDAIQLEKDRQKEKVKPTKSFDTYQEEAREIHEKYSHKDERGKAKLITKETPQGPIQLFDIDKDQKKALDKEVEVLEKKHAEAISKQKKKEAAYQLVLQEESTFKKIDFPEKQLPKEINRGQLHIARKLLKITPKG